MQELEEIMISGPVRYRWAGRFAARNNQWKHMERALVDYELIVMEKGTLYIEDERRLYEVKEGEYLIMRPSNIQRGYKPSKCRFYWMHFLPGSEEQNAELLTLPGQGTVWNTDRLFVLLQQLQDADIRYMNQEYNRHLAMAVLMELTLQTRSHGYHKTASLEREKEQEQKELLLLEQVDEYILEHMSEPVTGGILAKEFGYHEKYLSTIFKKVCGRSVKQYVDQMKMERARYLLVNSDAHVVEIAEHLGYENVRNFYHVFRNHCDCTPSEYRMDYYKSKVVEE